MYILMNILILAIEVLIYIFAERLHQFSESVHQVVAAHPVSSTRGIRIAALLLIVVFSILLLYQLIFGSVF